MPAGLGAVWAGVVFAALLFAAVHLGNAGPGAELTIGVVSSFMTGNAIIGLVCGWLYWRRGLESAIVAHVSIDLVLKVLGPALGIWR